MDRPAAVKLIRDTFENSFDKGSFINLSKNLVKYLDDLKNFTYQGNIIPDAYDQSIQTLERVGKYEDADSNKIDVLIVRLKKERSLERARTMQRNFVAWYLNGSRGGELKDAALVAFVSPDDRDWRFSLVRMDYNLVESPTGRVKVEKELTPARRYSFLVGESESSHTAQVQLLPILENDERKPLLSDFEKAFSIEVVTREFFTRYRELFHKVEEALQKLVEQNKRIRDDFEAKGVDTVNFAKKLLGQVVFLYFLQKKGWFGVGRDEDWGTGPKYFLRRLFEKKIAPYGNFFNDVLEPLFYEALAVERTDDFYSRFNCKIPFLNGGLFDPINNYDWVHTDILLPNELFSNTERTKEGDIGTGILDVFDRYNFTVKEDEPLDKEVAVDPEMLGKVFENLLEVKDRKSKGTYYTPREIVHYMCQESLINYLDTAINMGEVPLVATPPPQSKLFGKPDPEQGALKAPGYRAIVPREDIEALVRKGELAIEHDTQVEARGKETERYSYKLPGGIRWNAKLIDEKLAGIRVCDPAIGSGAFPVGLMTEIVRARNTLSTYLSDKEGRTNYNFKRHAIQNCLYGVDIDPGAVEIAKLRLWLSLVVDEEDIKQIQPLPNLDYKIMQGNSLIEDFHGISLDFGENGKGRPKLFEEDSELLCLVENLHRKQDNLFNATHPSEKEQHKAQVENAIVDVFHHELKRQRATYFQFLENIERKACQIPNVEDQYKYYKAEKAILDNKYGFDFEALERELREMTHGNRVRPFFPWKLYFANVFREKGGFDVVIANPPYVEHKKLKEVSSLLKDDYETYSGTADIYVYFYEKGLSLLRENGFLAFISSNKFFKTSYGAKLRSLLSTNKISQIIDFTKVHVFDALVATCVMLISKRKPQNDVPVSSVGDDFIRFLSLNEYIRTHSMPVESRKLDASIWQLEDSRELAIKARIESDCQELYKVDGICIYRGVTTGCNEAFLVNGNVRSSLVKSDPRNKEIIKPLLQGRNIRKWFYKECDEFLIFTRRGIAINSYPTIKKYLYRFRDKLEPGKGRKPGQYNWYEIQDNTAYYQEFEKEKIIWGLTADKWTFAYDDKGHYLPSNGYILTSSQVPIKLLLAVLNSHLMEYYFKFIGIMTAGGAFTLKYETVAEFPVKNLPEPKQKILINLVDQILAITKDEDYLSNPTKQAKVKELERQIDQMVYELYGLTFEEITVVEGKKGQADADI